MKKLAYVGVLLVLSFLFVPQALAANLTFDENTVLDLTGLDTTLYARSGSEADSVEVSGATLTVVVPAGSTFTLGAGSPLHNVLRVTPSGGSVTLTFSSANFSGGYTTQWVLNSTAASSWALLVGVSQASTPYDIKVNNSLYSTVTSNSSGEVSFTYTGNFSNRTFTISQQSPTPTPTSSSTTGTSASGGSSSGGSSSSSGSSTCTTQPPGSAPLLYEVDIRGTSAALYFAPASHPYTNYYVSFGDGAADEGYGAGFSLSQTTGALKYDVYHLKPYGVYTFKVRAGNGCRAGEWSRTMTVRTGAKHAKTLVKYYPKKQAAYPLLATNAVTGIGRSIKKVFQPLTNKKSATPQAPVIQPQTPPAKPQTPVIKSRPAANQSAPAKSPAPQKTCFLFLCW